MNVFVLCTGRCGSTTFAKACRHMTNFTAGHETLARTIGDGRLAYPPDHIEVDNRLSWFLGALDARFGDDAHYVHLTRRKSAVVESFEKRFELKGSIIRAYRDQILLGARGQDAPAVCEDYVETVTANIELFLKDKTKVMPFRIERARKQFPRFWRWIGATGDLDAALAEFGAMHNASIP